MNIKDLLKDFEKHVDDLTDLDIKNLIARAIKDSEDEEDGYV